jgi:hypothetical protein
VLQQVFFGRFKKNMSKIRSVKDEFVFNENKLYMDLIFQAKEDSSDVTTKYYDFDLFIKANYDGLRFDINIRRPDKNITLEDVRNGIDDKMEEDDDPMLFRKDFTEEQKDKLAKMVYPILKDFMNEY